MAAYEIPYGTEQHNDIVAAINRRYQFSARYMRRRHDAWKRSEEEHQAYIPETDVAQEAEASREQGKPAFQTLVIPYSYAMLLAAHTYWSTVFLSRDPILQFTGRHGESQQQVTAVEAVMNYQTQVGAHIVPYYVWLLDAGKYGLGVVGNYWDSEIVTVSSLESRMKRQFGVPLPGTSEKIRRTRRIPGYQGTRIYNVRPWDFFPDPRVSLQNLQKGEFCGRWTRSSWNEILRGQQQGRYFNVKALHTMFRSEYRNPNDSSSSTMTKPAGMEGGTEFIDAKDMGFVDLLEMYIELVPKEWKLGKSEYAEKWVFTLARPGAAGGGVLIGAQPYPEYHAKFPFDILEYEFDGYDLLKRGMYDVLRPMQDVMNWLVNTHFYNIRRSLNDMIIVDPSRIVMRDLLTPGPGKIIRAKPSAYGQDVRMFANQLDIADFTREHIQDTEVMSGFMQRVTGVNDQLMSVLNMGGRRSATEVRQANAFGVNRLKTGSEYFSAVGWAPLTQKLVQSTQQHYDAQLEHRIAGNIIGADKPFVAVSPQLISGFYDYVPVDGNMPIDRFAQVNLWTQLLGQLRQYPQIAGQYDLARIFAFVAQLAGLKNINQFKIQVQPDQAVQASAQQGDVVPIGGGATEPSVFARGTTPG